MVEVERRSGEEWKRTRGERGWQRWPRQRVLMVSGREDERVERMDGWMS